MKHIYYQLTILLLLLSITVSLPPNNTLAQGYQSLTIHNNHYQLQFSYHQLSANIPQSLTSLLHKSSIHQLTLLMGTISNNPSIVNDAVVNHGIFLILKNSSQLLYQNFQSIAQALSISRSQQYMVYITQSQTLFISNPNDKFCAHHLNTIIDLFLPCGTKSGIGSIINEKSFFVGKMFVGVKLYWNVDSEIVNLTFMMDKSAQQVNNYLKLSQQKRQTRRCMHFGQLAIITPQSNNNKYQPNSSHPIMLTSTSITAQFVSNYYSQDKSLFIHLDLDKLMRELQSQLNDNSYSMDSNPSSSEIVFTFRLMLPDGFSMQDVAFRCQHCDQQLLSNITINSQRLLYRVDVNINKTILQHQRQQSFSTQPLLIYQFYYQSSLKPFEQYENVAGGGEEFMNVPLTVQLGNQSAVFIVSNSLRNMFDRLLQPDFSIPFKTITFTLVIIGYLWISLWRAFYAQNHHPNNNQSKSSLNEQSYLVENAHNQQLKTTSQPSTALKQD